MPPDPSFIPLAPNASAGANDRPDFRLTVASQPFQALGHKLPGVTHAAALGREPRVTLRRENNRVTAIVVECSCGQTIELACVYEETSPPPVPQPPAFPATAPAPPASAPLAAAPAPAPPPPSAAEKSKDKAPARKTKR